MLLRYAVVQHGLHQVRIVGSCVAVAVNTAAATDTTDTAITAGVVVIY
jgi:hypothetical protein